MCVCACVIERDYNNCKVQHTIVVEALWDSNHRRESAPPPSPLPIHPLKIHRGRAGQINTTQLKKRWRHWMYRVQWRRLFIGLGLGLTGGVWPLLALLSLSTIEACVVDHTSDTAILSSDPTSPDSSGGGFRGMIYSCFYHYPLYPLHLTLLLLFHILSFPL